MTRSNRTELTGNILLLARLTKLRAFIYRHTSHYCYMVMRWRYRNMRNGFHYAPEALAQQHAVTYSGDFVALGPNATSCAGPLEKGTILHFSGPNRRLLFPLKKGKSSRLVGAAKKLIADVLLRDYLDHPNILEMNFKQRRLQELGVKRILTFNYPASSLHFHPLCWISSLRLYEDPAGYYDEAAQSFVEQLLLPFITTEPLQERGANGLLIIDQCRPVVEVLPQLHMTWCAYSYGGEFIHQIRNCFYAYLVPHYTLDEIKRIFNRFLVISAGANNPLLVDAPIFCTLRILHRDDEHVLKKLNVHGIYPSHNFSPDGNVVVEVTPNESVIWVNHPYQFEADTYDNNQKVQKPFVNSGFHQERAYFYPRYFPKTAYRTLLQWLR